MPCRACADLDNDITDAISNINDGITLITTPVQYIPFPVGADSFSFILFTIIPSQADAKNPLASRSTSLRGNCRERSLDSSPARTPAGHVSQAQAGLSPFVEQLDAHDRIAGMAAVFPTVRDLSAGDVNMITDLLIKCNACAESPN